MTYYNGNPYKGEVTEFAHDGCLPADRFTTVVLSDGSQHTQQNQPWHWSPIWGRPQPCKFCKKPVA